MKHLLVTIVIALAQFLGVAASAAEPLSLSVDVNDPIGAHVTYLQEGAEPLSLEDARQAYEAGRFQSAGGAMMNFGIGANPVWLAVTAENPTATALKRRVLFEVSWIDQIDLYFLRQDEVIEYQRVGDTLAFDARPTESRYFNVPHAFETGPTTMLMRVESSDPMALPIYVVTPQEAEHRSTLEAYTYGFVYGVIIALLAYNFILFLSLKRASYAFYALYLACFVAANLAYTGHGYWWFWSANPSWQMWSNPVLMIVYGVSGLVFAMSFLETKRNFPRLHRFVAASALTFVVLEAATIAGASQVGALLVAFVFILFFSPVMVLLGLVSVLNGITFAKYFLIAALAAVAGAAITALTVWGLVPYSVWGYRAVEVGMMIDAVLLALALANRFRVSQEQKNRAEELARIDPLTGLNNRRGFYEMVAPVWSTGLRHNRSMSVIVLDLDHFKAFNDTYGHSMGDEVLVAVAHELKPIGRAGDIAARWGGEEFILFLPETTQDEAVSVAMRLREDIKAKRLDFNGKDLFITASFGVAQRQDDSTSLDDLIDAADQKLYAAKQQGRDRVCVA